MIPFLFVHPLMMIVDMINLAFGLPLIFSVVIVMVFFTWLNVKVLRAVVGGNLW